MCAAYRRSVDSFLEACLKKGTLKDDEECPVHRNVDSDSLRKSGMLREKFVRQIPACSDVQYGSMGEGRQPM